MLVCNCCIACVWLLQFACMCSCHSLCATATPVCDCSTSMYVQPRIVWLCSYMIFGAAAAVCVQLLQFVCSCCSLCSCYSLCAMLHVDVCAAKDCMAVCSYRIFGAAATVCVQLLQFVCSCYNLMNMQPKIVWQWIAIESLVQLLQFASSVADKHAVQPLTYVSVVSTLDVEQHLFLRPTVSPALTSPVYALCPSTGFQMKISSRY